MKQLAINISDEMLLKKISNGIQLIKPNNSYQQSLPSIATILKLPMSVHFLDKKCIIQNTNEFAINSCGYPSLKATIGKTWHIVVKKEAANMIIHNHLEVLQKNQILIKEEHFIGKTNDVSFPVIRFRYPLYDEQKSNIGILSFGFALKGSELSLLTQGLAALMDLGLLGKVQNYSDIFSFHRVINGVYLSQREFECVKLLVKGKTIKMIAQILGLSPRTVEHYLENIRSKLGIASKTELIDVVINHIINQS